MREVFFKAAEAASIDNVKRFLQHFPEREFWRFFVERKRYEYREVLYRKLYQKVAGVSEQEASYVHTSEIKKILHTLTIKELFQIAQQKEDYETLHALKYVFNVQDRTEEKVTDLIDKHRGWIGFEDNEPGYLAAVTNGLGMIFESLSSNEEFNFEFVKKLHKIATQDVNKMLDQTPGELRKRPAVWFMSIESDSIEGLIENLIYIKSLGPDAKIRIEHNNEVIDLSGEPAVVAQLIWSFLKKGERVNYHASDSQEFLEKVSNTHIVMLNKALKKAVSKEDKLTAIFTYLKYTVLHHSFQDGVGRTYSMLLLQYLLMRENLLPVIIVDSNMIPGVSVGEMVKEYLRAEEEMEHILANPSYINSESLVKPNVNTSEVLLTASEEEVKVFNACLYIYQSMRENYLSREHEKASSLSSS